ncbi:hypothetical protein SDC9_164240 [bioreactor metagenome]|uniref:Uncharacterized protein n=1 Tax=bioreactor metagenome TaxID=1076179 RepID=A0A645FYA7_9ZZZZ
MAVKHPSYAAKLRSLGNLLFRVGPVPRRIHKVAAHGVGREQRPHLLRKQRGTGFGTKAPLPSVRRAEPSEKPEQRTFSRSVSSDNRQKPASLGADINSAKYLLALSPVAKPRVGKRDRRLPRLLFGKLPQRNTSMLIYIFSQPVSSLAHRHRTFAFSVCGAKRTHRRRHGAQHRASRGSQHMPRLARTSVEQHAPGIHDDSAVGRGKKILEALLRRYYCRTELAVELYKH